MISLLPIKLYFLKRLSSRIISILFWSSFVFKVFLSAYIVYLYGIHIFILPYSVLSIRLSYVVSLFIGFGLLKYWEKFIKRKLHYIIIGDNKKI